MWYKDLGQIIGLDNISAGIDIFPLSWMEPAMRIPSILSLGNPFSVAIALARSAVLI
jgi:hypothetical protein